MQSVKGILTVCSQFGEGGWQYMDPPWADWLVSVQGTGDLEEVEKIGDGTVGGDLLSSRRG